MSTTVVGSEKERPFNLDELFEEKSLSVYVLNTHEREGQRSKVVIEVSVPNGAPRTVVVPNTWIPIDLALQVPKSALLQSPNFLTAVNRRLIKLVRTSTASKLM